MGKFFLGQVHYSHLFVHGQVYFLYIFQFSVLGGIKKIDESLYKEHINTEFGRQYVNTLQLCAMLKKKAESGYYQVDHCVQFGMYHDCISIQCFEVVHRLLNLSMLEILPTNCLLFVELKAYSLFYEN